MQNPLHNVVARTQEFVADHKVAIAVTITAVTTTVVMAKLRGGALKDHFEFLDERGLTDEYSQWVVDNALV